MTVKVLRITLSLESSEREGLPHLLGGVVIRQGMSLRQIEDAMRESARFVTQYMHEHELLCADLDVEDIPYVHEV